MLFDRSPRFDSRPFWLIAMFAAIGMSGCSAGAMALYIVKGTNVEAECEELRNRSVVVVCRPGAMIQYNNSDVARALAKQLGILLKENVRHVEVISQRKVEDWTDENVWTDYQELGEALEAELVLSVDLEAFSLYQGQTLYQGRANVSFTLIEVETGETLFEKIMPQTVYPPNTGIPTSDRQEPEFRRQFIRELAYEIGRHFYAHDTRLDFAKDSEAFDL